MENDALTFMVSDDNQKQKVSVGDNVQMSISGGDGETLTKFFNGLAKGGKVDFPLKKEFWGDTFGMLTDKFGMQWMVNYSYPKKK